MKQHTLRNMLAFCNWSITESMAERLAERHANVIAALQRIFPAIINGFITRLQENPELMQVAGEATRTHRGQRSLAAITDEDTLQKGHDILQQLFGVYNVDIIGKQIARATMVRSSSALKLMQWAAPLCFAVMGKEAIEHKLDAAMMGEWLKQQPLETENQAPAWQVKTVAPTKTTSPKKVRDLSWVHFFVLVVCGGVLFWILRS